MTQCVVAQSPSHVQLEGDADSACSHSSVPAHALELVRAVPTAVAPYAPDYENDW